MCNYIHTRAGRTLIFTGYLLLTVAAILPVITVKSIAVRAIPAPGVVPADSIYLYLSFDDGPSAGSPLIDSIVRADSIRVNVFIVGNIAFHNDSTTRLLKLYGSNPLVEIGNHSFSHAANRFRHYYKNAPQVLEDFNRNDSLLRPARKIARLPGRNAWHLTGRSACDLPDAKAAADSLYNNGYLVFGWDMEWRGNPGCTGAVQPADTVVHHLERLIGKHTEFSPRNIVILCHDSMFCNIQAVTELGKFIAASRQKGSWRFEHLSDYPRKQSSIYMTNIRPVYKTGH